MTASPLKYPARVKVLMLSTCRGAKAGANSITTRPAGNSTYSVFSRSSGRQSLGSDAANTSLMLGCLAAGTGQDKKTSTVGIKNLKLAFMDSVLHETEIDRRGGEMRGIPLCCLALLIVAFYAPPAGR